MDYKWFGEGEIVSLPKGVKDDFLDILAQEVASQAGQGGVGISSGNTSPFIEIQGNVDGELTDLRLIAVTPADSLNDLYISYATTKEAPDESRLDQYRRALKIAREKFERDAPLASWCAIIGQIPNSLEHKTLHLSGNERIGNLRLSNVPQMMIEAVQTTPPSLHQFAMRETYPIKVKGKSRGYSWEGASANAAKDLNLLTALLSTLWCQLIDVRVIPTDTTHGEPSTPRHPAWSGSAMFDREEWSLKVEETDIRKVELPDRTDQMWNKLKKETRLSLALDSFKEGMRCESTSPSLALVCFIACIESISQKVFKRNRCEECEGHRFISAKFKKTLELVVHDTQTRDLLGNAYDLRSRTVHDGKLHGLETIPIRPRSSFFESNPELVFQWQTVSQMKRAAQKLLIIALKGELPSRRKFSFG